VAINSVADSPFIATAQAELARVGSYAQKVPLRYYRLGLIAIALFWVCHTVATLFWTVIPAPTLPIAKVTPTTSTVSTSTRTNVDITAVQKLNLFGDFNKAAVVDDAPTPQEDQNLEKTKLNIELQGVIAASEPELSWAIIGRGDNQKLYKIGDVIDNAQGAKVSKIYDIKIVINNRGKLEELWLYGEDGKKFATSAPVRQAPTARPAQQKAVIKASDVKKAKNIGDVVRFMVATDNGKMIGYKVRPGRQRELFDQVGLKTDDIVVSVNGIEVNEPQKVREVYQALKTATEANLEVLRDGTTLSIPITMDTEG